MRLCVFVRVSDRSCLFQAQKLSLPLSHLLPLPAMNLLNQEVPVQMEQNRKKKLSGKPIPDGKDSAPKSKKSRKHEKEIEQEKIEASRLENLLFGNLQDPAHLDFGHELHAEFPLSVKTAVGDLLGYKDAFGNQEPGKDAAQATTKGGTGQPLIQERKPVWEDEEEATTTVKLSNVNRLRKLMREGEEKVSGTDYVSRLRAQHAKLNAATSWAELPSDRRMRLRRRGRDSDSESDDSDAASELEDVEQDVLLSNADLVVKNKSRLPRGLIEISRMRDANGEEPSNAVVQSVEFHRNAQILLTAGLDKKLRFFQIDGKRNPKVQSIFMEDLPIHKASFVPDGSQVIASGRRNFFYTYDMQKGSVEKISPLIGREEKSLESFEVSSDGKLVAFLGNEGYILLASLRTKQLIGTLKMNGSVRAVCFAAEGKELFSSGGDGEIYQWDVSTRRCIFKGRDEGCIQSTALSLSPSSKFLAAGSHNGVVNLYEREKFIKGVRSPVKAFMNLRTTVDNLKFNVDAQILAMTSRMKKNALRLVHLPSYTVFSNWPTAQTPLLYVHSLDFSPGGGFLAVGNAAGKVLLYRLRHYEHA